VDGQDVGPLVVSDTSRDGGQRLGFVERPRRGGGGAVDHDTRPQTSQVRGHHAADAAGGAGDPGDLVVQER
jgi:hypothetical protein